MTNRAAACFVLNLQIRPVFCGIKCHQEINCLPEGVRIKRYQVLQILLRQNSFHLWGAPSVWETRGLTSGIRPVGFRRRFRAEGFDSRRQERAKPYEKIRLSMLLKRIFYVWDDICMSLIV